MGGAASVGAVPRPKQAAAAEDLPGSFSPRCAAILDNCIQVLRGALPEDAPPQLFMPRRISRVRLHAPLTVRGDGAATANGVQPCPVGEL